MMQACKSVQNRESVNWRNWSECDGFRATQLTIWCFTLRFLTLLSLRIRTDCAWFVFEHTRVASIVSACVDELSLLSLVERHFAARTACPTCLVLENLPNRRQICNESRWEKINQWRLRIQIAEMIGGEDGRRDSAGRYRWIQLLVLNTLDVLHDT